MTNRLKIRSDDDKKQPKLTGCYFLFYIKYFLKKVLTNLSIYSIIYLQVVVERLISHDGTLNSVKTSVPQA